MYQVLYDGADTEVWMEMRRTGVTATDIARLSTGGAGVRSAIKAEKAGHERRFSTRATQHGKDREPIIATFAHDAFGHTHNTALLAAADELRFLATPDLLNGTGDIKTTVHDWDTWDDVPAQYRPQLMWQMRVTGDREARLYFEPHEGFVPIYPSPKFLVLEYDEAYVAELEEQALEFLAWDGEPDADAAELDALMAAYASDKEVADAATRAVELRKQAIEEYLEHQPRKFEGSLGLLNRGADSVSMRLDGPGLKKADPDLYEQWTKPVKTKGALRITLRSDK